MMYWGNWGVFILSNVVLANGYHFFICHYRAGCTQSIGTRECVVSPKSRPAKGLGLMNHTASIR